MRNILMIAGLSAAVALGAGEAKAQDSVFKPRSGASTQMSIDVSQYDPQVQIGEILRTTKMLAQQNEQMRGELAAMQKKLDDLGKRGESLSRILTTGTGEYIGSMVRKIKDKTVGPY